MVDLSSLRDLPSQADGWSPLTPQALDGPDMYVECFDQSLVSTGYVEVFREDGSIMIGRVETIKPPEDTLTGFEQDYARALYLEREAKRLILGAPFGCHVVHETPPVPTVMMLKKNGPRAGVPARMGGQSVRSAAAQAFTPAEHVWMVNAQQCKKLVCGNAKAEKKEAHDALRTLTWIENLDRALKNEHLRDAVLLGLNILNRSK